MSCIKTRPTVFSHDAQIQSQGGAPRGVAERTALGRRLSPRLTWGAGALFLPTRCSGCGVLGHTLGGFLRSGGAGRSESGVQWGENAV